MAQIISHIVLVHESGINADIGPNKNAQLFLTIFFFGFSLCGVRLLTGAKAPRVELCATCLSITSV